jgi:hypothetical protein
MQKISKGFDKNPSSSQKYGKTVCAWITMQICVLCGQKARVHISEQQVGVSI